MIRHPHIAIVVTVAALTGSCGESGPTDDVQLPMSEDTYVEIMAELARLRRRPPQARGQLERDRVADSLRSELLARHGVTPEQVLEFADAAGSDPARMHQLAELISAAGDSLDAEQARADSARIAPPDTGSVTGTVEESAGSGSDSTSGVVDSTGRVEEQGAAEIGPADADSALGATSEAPPPRFADPPTVRQSDSTVNSDGMAADQIRRPPREPPRLSPRSPDGQ